MARKSWTSEVERVLKDMNLPGSFLVDLLREPHDWSFIIKLHALVEGVSTHLLIADLGDERLREPISHLEMSNSRTGKVAFLKALELIESDDRSFISSLSELRNQLVHGIANIEFSLEHKHEGSVGRSLDRLLKSTEHSWDRDAEYAGKKRVLHGKFLGDKRRVGIWLSAVRFIDSRSPYMPSKGDSRGRLVRALIKQQRGDASLSSR